MGLHLKTVPELKEMAKSLFIPGYAQMKKDDLVAAISKFEPSSDEAADPIESSSAPADLVMHPKFAKFKRGEN